MRAHRQSQLDIYGGLLDSIYLYNKYGAPISYDLWRNLWRLLEYVCDNWRRPDEGIWEIRGEPRHFVYSKLMCWVALDRGLRLANKRSFPANQERWLKNRDQIYCEIMEKGWNAELQFFRSVLRLRPVGRESAADAAGFFRFPRDPRMVQTINRIKDHLALDTLVHRYHSAIYPGGRHRRARRRLQHLQLSGWSKH